MIDDKDQNDVNLLIKFDEDFERQVSGGGLPYNPRVSLGIQAGGKSISGSKKGYTGIYFLDFFGEFLESIEEIRDGNKKIIRTGDEPAYIVLEPQDDSVRLSKCFSKESAKNPNNRLSIEPEAHINKEKIINEVIRASDETLREMRNINNKIDEYSQIREFESLLNEVKESKENI